MFNLIARRIDRIRVRPTLRSHRSTLKSSGVLWISSTGGPKSFRVPPAPASGRAITNSAVGPFVALDPRVVLSLDRGAVEEAARLGRRDLHQLAKRVAVVP